MIAYGGYRKYGDRYKLLIYDGESETIQICDKKYLDYFMGTLYNFVLYERGIATHFINKNFITKISEYKLAESIVIELKINSKKKSIVIRKSEVNFITYAYLLALKT